MSTPACCQVGAAGLLYTIQAELSWLPPDDMRSPARPPPLPRFRRATAARRRTRAHAGGSAADALHNTAARQSYSVKLRIHLWMREPALHQHGA